MVFPETMHLRDAINALRPRLLEQAGIIDMEDGQVHRNLCVVQLVGEVERFMEGQNRGRGLGFMLGGTQISPRAVFSAMASICGLLLSVQLKLSRK